MSNINSISYCEACGSSEVYVVLSEKASEYFIRNNVYGVFCRECDHKGTVLLPIDGSGDSSWTDEHLTVPTPDDTSEDWVNKPPHYRKHPSGVECIDITEHMDFCLGNATKYIWRAGLKGANEVEDLQKAIYYLNRKIELCGKA